MTDTTITHEERAERCLLEPSGPGVNQLTKARIVSEIREAVDAALERAAREVGFHRDGDLPLGICTCEICWPLKPAMDRILALKSIASKPEMKK